MINRPATSDRTFCASAPAIVVYGLNDARAALQAAAEAGVAVTLLSPAGAAAYGGPAWFRQLIEQAREAVPDARFTAVLDCADNAGDAMAALRAGVPVIAFGGPERVHAKIRDMARQTGSEVVTSSYAGALDLADRVDAPSDCRAWLAQESTRSGP